MKNRWMSISASDRRRVLRLLWNLRGLGLFLIGPAIGVWAAASIFGMPRGLQALAGLTFLFSLGIMGLLVRGEWRRMSGER